MFETKLRLGGFGGGLGGFGGGLGGLGGGLGGLGGGLGGGQGGGCPSPLPWGVPIPPSYHNHKK